MSVKKRLQIIGWLAIVGLSSYAIHPSFANDSLAKDSLAKQLGWVPEVNSKCGGYYLEEPFFFPSDIENQNVVKVFSKQTLFSTRSTSLLEGNVSVIRHGQQITANKAYLYRDPTTYKLTSIDMIGQVHLRQPNTLVVGKKGHYDFKSQAKSLSNILYRMVLNGKQFVGAESVPEEQAKTTRKVSGMVAWGKAYQFSQTEPKIYELSRTSFSTCPPVNPAWRVKASHLVLNKNTGRGYATHARLYIKDVPVMYTPYLNFSIDGQRKSGFLWPTIGPTSTRWGPYVLAPFYWNMAPNYDMTLTPGLLSTRGVQVSDNFRYLTDLNQGHITITALPGDRAFIAEQTKWENSVAPSTIAPNIYESELRRLQNDSTTRKAFVWKDDAQFNKHWSSHVDFNYVGDDYYAQDFGNNFSQVTQNQLLQFGEVNYKGENWNFTSRVQAYQTLHPINEPTSLNQYRRFPQFLLNGDYPDQPLGLDYSISNEMTHFEILNNPGTTTPLPIGNRFHTQPGVSLPFNLPYFYINPRAQLALSQYDLYQTGPTNTPTQIRREVPIFDVASGTTFVRDFNVFQYSFQQTLEPQVYYTYIPYRAQNAIPIFDTTVNTLSYDQIFNYNRFTGIDRIGDANQMGAGITTRFIDSETGLEKIKASLGGLIYFANRIVTLSTSPLVTDNPNNHSNYQRVSPLSGSLAYHVQDNLSLTNESLWNPVTKQIDSSVLGFLYSYDPAHVMNFTYSFVRNGDILTGIQTNTSKNNLKLTDVTYSWQVIRDVSVVGRWSEDWNLRRLQNFLVGLQYDTCCWAVRMVGGQEFIGLDPTKNNSLQYNSQMYLQFALKGLGNIGRDPSGILTSVSGYLPQFG